MADKRAEYRRQKSEDRMRNVRALAEWMEEKNEKSGFFALTFGGESRQYSGSCEQGIL
jgi:hypothetical protein